MGVVQEGGPRQGPDGVAGFGLRHPPTNFASCLFSETKYTNCQNYHGEGACTNQAYRGKRLNLCFKCGLAWLERESFCLPFCSLAALLNLLVSLVGGLT